MWGVIKLLLLLLLAVVKRYVQNATKITTQKKQFEVTDQLTHADWCNSKCGLENLENCEEHWAKTEPKNSISHLV